MSKILDHIDALHKRIAALQPINTEYKQRIDKKFRLEFNYNSNHMEGNTLTYGETELLLIFEDTKGNHSLREYEEMRNHDVAFKLVEEWASERERQLTEQNIKNLNEVILVRPFWKEAITPDGQPTKRLIEIGNYKKFPNSVRLQNGELFHYTSPTDTPIEMADLIEWYRAEEKGLHPVTLATMLHYKFVRIHPFDDGNGRVARLLLNYVLLRNRFPPVIIKSDDKTNYLRALHQADTGEYEPLISYVGEQLIWSQQIVLKGAKGESIDEPGDFDKRVKFIMDRLHINDQTEVRVSKSRAAIVDAWDIALLPLFQRIEKKLSKVSAWFKSTTKEIVLISPQYNVKFKGEIENLGPTLSQNSIETDEIFFDYRLSGLRTAPNLNLSTRVFVIFHTNVYEVKSDTSKDSISKLYDESLTDEEIDLIASSLGNFLVASVEKQLDENRG